MLAVKPDLNFEFRLFDLYSEDHADLQKSIQHAADSIDSERLRGTLQLISHELIANALKTVYKKMYVEHFLVPMGYNDIAYEEWLACFRSEVEENKAENFARLCRAEDVSITVRGKVVNDIFRLDIINPGVPSEIEWNRIRKLLEKAKRLESMEAFFLQEGEDRNREAGGLGIVLIVMSLRGLGIDPDYFRLLVEGDATVARIELPLAVRKLQKKPIQVLSSTRKHLGMVWNLYNEMGFATVRFDLDGQIIAVSRQLLDRLGIPEQNIDYFHGLIPPRFFDDIFNGPAGVRISRAFRNYRVYIPDLHNSQEFFFEVSGYVSKNGSVTTLWQLIQVRDSRFRLSEGTLSGNLKVQHMIEPYIPSLVLSRARDLAHLGRNGIPDEVREQTILFADLVNFTSASEESDPSNLVEMLNMSLGLSVHSIIRQGGLVDKFMGDAVMAVFSDPLSAVAAGIEIQNNFIQLNGFRELQNQAPILIRIGINTGPVIFCSIGTSARKDWTVIGDTVNIAARLEKYARHNSVLIGEETYNKISSHLDVSKRYLVSLKDLSKQIPVYYVEAVSLKSQEGEFKLQLLGQGQSLQDI